MSNSMKQQVHGFFVSIYRKIFIITFYLVLIVGSLYAPLIFDFFGNKEAVLNIYTFTNNFKEELIRDFEQLYNVKVNIRYFDSNEELLAKFKISGGKGYDIITPSDYMVQLLSNVGLLHKIDKNNLSIYNELDQKLLGHYFDKNNDYSLPLMWFPYGIVYAKDIVKSNNDPISYDIIFKNPAERLSREQKYRICMCDDYRESIVFASLYLYGNYDPKDLSRLSVIQELLVTQKKWIESYVNQDLRYYLLAGIIKAAVAPAVFVRKIMEESSLFDFKIPREGGLVTIENIAIPQAASNKKLAYAFINFILSRNNAAANASLFGFNPSNALAYSLLDAELLKNNNFFPNKDLFAKLYVLSNDIPVKAYEQLWLTVKSN